MHGQSTNVWVGKFDSKDQFESFLKEEYSKSDDDAPISEFAKSQNKTYYDHDWLEYYFSEDQQSLLEKLDPKYINAVKSVLDKKSIGDVNGLILYSEEWSNPVEVSGEPPLWYLGIFDNAYLKSLQSERTAQTSSSEFWMHVPDNAQELEELEAHAKDDTASLVKLAALYACGIFVRKDIKKARSILAQANAPVKMQHEAFMSLANDGHVDAWHQLFELCIDEGEGIVSENECHGYLESGARLGSDDAKSTLASLLMYGGSNRFYDKDLVRAEALFLSISEFKTGSDLHEVYCLYSMMENDEQAFVWKKREADLYGDSFSAKTMYRFYKDGVGIQKDVIESVKYLYIAHCQEDASGFDLDSHTKEYLTECSIQDIAEGRSRAKRWIADIGISITASRGKLAYFSGENLDPFDAYLKTRESNI